MYHLTTKYPAHPKQTHDLLIIQQIQMMNSLQYSALVKDAGVFKGYEDGTLGAGNDITRENMAIVLVRAFDAIHKTDLVTYVADQEFDKDVTGSCESKR